MQTYKFQTVLQLGKIIHFAKYLTICCIQSWGSVKTVPLKLNSAVLDYFSMNSETSHSIHA